MVIETTTLLRWIPLLPLAAAVTHGVLIGLLRKPLARGAVIALSCGALLASFFLSIVSFAQLVGIESSSGERMLLDHLYTWMGVGVGDAALSADFAFQFDALSAVMCLVVTGVGLLIHIYSVGYMDEDHRDDRGFQRFFCYLNLFICAMLMLVLGDNLLVMFLGWEGVGLCSYLLIGFWYSEKENAYAGSKAFIVNRIGDFGFLIGIFLIFWAMSSIGEPSLAFRDIEANFAKIAELTVQVPAVLGGQWSLPTLIGLCLFVGACGKSAQLPLFVWLPDAMAGPTPVSALIHAATMVTAGVYMVCRMSFLYAATPEASAVVAWVGGLTAFFAATIAVAQHDIKKVLAYSTVSQLGYMFLAAGCGAYSAAMFHVVTHAFFKALLFLGAGSVILACHHEQDMRKMGGLRKRLPQSHLVILVGVLAIAGMPGLSGFFSKDEILLAAYTAHAIPGHAALYWLALATAAITSFYMFRLYIMTFHGSLRVDPAHRTHIREPSTWVIYPLFALAILSVLGGYAGLPQFWGDMIGMDHSDSLGNFLVEVVASSGHHTIEQSTEWWLVAGAVASFLAGGGLAVRLYASDKLAQETWTARGGAFYRLLVDKYRIDELYDAVFVRPLVAISDRVLFRAIDAGVIDGALVNGTAAAVRGLASGVLKHAHSGATQSYLFAMVVGLLAIFAAVVW